MGESVLVPRNESSTDHAPEAASHADAPGVAAAGEVVGSDQPNVWLNEGPKMALPRRPGTVTRDVVGRRLGVFAWRPTPFQAGLAIVALITAGGVAALSVVASHGSGGSAPVPVVTAIMRAPQSVAAAPTTSLSPAPTTQPLVLPVPPPADGPGPAGPTLGALTQPDPAAAGQQAGATPAVTGHEVTAPAPGTVVGHPASPVTDHSLGSTSRPADPPAPPDTPQDQSPQDQQSQWRWEKTTTCDESGRCVDHYNPKPTIGSDGSASPPASSSTTPDPDH